jgi:hypothetical protein
VQICIAARPPGIQHKSSGTCRLASKTAGGYELLDDLDCTTDSCLCRQMRVRLRASISAVPNRAAAAAPVRNRRIFYGRLAASGLGIELH